MPTVSVLIPAFNEEAFIAKTVEAVLSISGVERVLVIDDGSVDETAIKAKAAGAEILVLPRNLGKGGALNRGAGCIEGDIIVLADGDLGDSASELEKLIQPVRDGQTDMTIARFPFQGGGGFGLTKGLSKFILRVAAGFDAEAPLSGQRAIRRELWTRLLPLAPGFGVELAMTLKAIRAGYRVMEVPVDMKHRLTFRDWRGFVHRGKQLVHIVMSLRWALGGRG